LKQNTSKQAIRTQEAFGQRHYKHVKFHES